MTLVAALVLFAPSQGGLAQDALEALRQAVGTGSRPQVEALFHRPEDATYLFSMAERSGGLRNLRVKVFPAPPGWESETGYWATIHTFHQIQQDRDVVYPLVFSGSRFKLGSEIPEYATTGHARIETTWTDARLLPEKGRVEVATRLRMTTVAPGRALLFRLNDGYAVQDARLGETEAQVVEAEDRSIPRPTTGQVLRAGGLVIPWTADPVPSLWLRYGGSPPQRRPDKVAAHVAYVTAWWVPSLGRLPHRSYVRVTGPRDWVLRSEGPRIDPELPEFGPMPAASPEEKVEAFDSLIPISFPKVIGGRYHLAAELEEGGKTFRAYHLDPVQPDRAQRDVELMARAVRWLEEAIGPWPYEGYECYDADTYYGIESYSHTLLRRDVTTRFMTHEMVHTYFGGLVPSAYVKDTWNEGVTQYVDSVLFGGNADRTLQNGLRTLNIRVPLDRMGIAWEHGSASYYRGAYVLRMLESEIGLTAMLEALQALVRERRGEETLWVDLLPYFEKTGDTKLGWFWSQ
jgi:hypothetical protein